MGLTARAPASDLTRSSWALDYAGFSVQEGLRAGLSVAAIVVLHAWFDFPQLMITALGALLACLADAGTPGQERLRPLLAFAVIGAMTGMIFGLARNEGLWLAVPLAGLAIACASFARVYGPAAMQVGNLTSVWIVISLDDPLATLPDALELGGMFLLGALWAVLLTSVLWRIQASVPVKRSVADSYRALAAMTDGMREILARPQPEESAALWDRHARTLRRGGRDAIERARTLVMAYSRAHGFSSPRVARSWLRLEAADQVLGALIGVADILEAGCANVTVAARALRHLRAVLLVLASSIDTDKTPDLPRLTKSLDGIRGVVSALNEDDPLRRLVVVITERLAVTTTLTVPENLRPGVLADGRASVPLLERLWAPIRSNLNRSSAALRHAAMAGVASTLGLTVMLVDQHNYERWLVITMLMTMQPYFSLTWQRMIERVAGTVLGGVIASALGLVVHTPLAVALAMFPLAVFAFMIRKVSFALFLSALTPMIILLVESAAPGASELTIALMRAFYTVMGGLLAVICSLIMWPGRQPQKAMVEVRAAIRANIAFADATLAQLLGESPPETQTEARRAAGMASNALEAALSRGMLEPRLVRSNALNAAITIDAALRRLSGRFSVILWLSASGMPVEALRAWRQWLRDSTAAILGGGAIALPPRPTISAEGEVGDSFTRVARQIELIAGTMPRLTR